ncbi:MAG TPA: EAL domain-containing protein [Gammaproteobacteria bacterium]|nr:EAL domain-containing protein [Gammaproteobacteria bacterium]
MAKSIRARFLLTAALVVALSLPAALYTQYRVRLLTQESFQLMQEDQDLDWTFDSLTDSLQVTESAIYQYPLMLDAKSYRNILVRLAEVKLQARQLSEHYALRRHPLLRDFAANLVFAMQRLDEETQKLLTVLSDVETRFPAAAILLNDLQPGNVAFLEAVDLAIAEAVGMEDQPDQPVILQALNELRYAWAQQISSVRVFVANRSGLFGDPEASMANNLRNREIYIDRVDELLVELESYRKLGKLDFQQRESLEKMQEIRLQYESDFQRAVDIYTSNNWRADLPILRNEIRPILDQAWGILDLMKREMDGLSEQNVIRTLDTADTLSTVIWVFTAFIATTLLLAYLMFERVIRRPILDVTRALEAHGKGENYLPALAPRTQETAVLVKAFLRMQDQVQSRQTRLESILDNAAEGIITLDENGIIETFSRAAQQLFGYCAEEAIGRPVMVIVPLSPGGVFPGFLELCKSPSMSVSGHETTVTALRRDGSDFPMSVKVSKLETEARTLYIALVDDIGERMAMMENLRRMAEHDSLTGLYNRQYFLNELERVVENARRGSPREYALLYIDLDNFKFVNDTLGHMAGDQVLVEVTEMLSQRNRKSDLLARLGGDEFALLIYDTNESEVMQAAEAHRRLLADYVFKYEGKAIQIGCSIGVSLFGRSVVNKEDLLMQADIACHIAKRSGRNCVHLYEADDQQDLAAMSEDMGWARRIKEAISRDQFSLVSQPIMDLKTGKMNRHEVLLRMRNEDGHVIQPAGFISAAERFGLMRAIDRWVIDHAIEALGHRLKKQPDLHFSINLSAESIGEVSMLEVITNALQRHSVPPTAVTFEVTETVAIANLGAALKFLEQLRALGCRTALDDFGVGYSSFAYLKDLPVDSVKIDGSFVRDIHRDALQLAMVRSMNDIAHAMGKTTIAEYVDSEACIAILKEIGVDYAQGFHVGMPMPLNEAPEKGDDRKAEVVRLLK